MIIKSKHHPFFYTYFRLYYTNWKIHQNFHEVKFLGDIKDKNLPVLVIANHMSWWDGIWVMLLNIRILKKRFHFMMLNEQLQKNKLLNYVGGYSVQKKSKSIIESINYTLELLSNQNNMVLLFPQGEIQSQFTNTLLFEKGIDHILKKLNGSAQVLFVVNLVDYFSHPKPTVYMYLQEYSSVAFEPGIVQKEYNSFYTKCMAEHTKTES
jgi:1-acyl-sn-glycerol-3-phosphate acyltransferase